MGPLTAVETALVKTLPITLDLLGVVNGPPAGPTLISTTPVWHDSAAEEQRKKTKIENLDIDLKK